MLNIKKVVNREELMNIKKLVESYLRSSFGWILTGGTRSRMRISSIGRCYAPMESSNREEKGGFDEQLSAVQKKLSGNIVTMMCVGSNNTLFGHVVGKNVLDNQPLSQQQVVVDFCSFYCSASSLVAHCSNGGDPTRLVGFQ